MRGGNATRLERSPISLDIAYGGCHAPQGGGRQSSSHQRGALPIVALLARGLFVRRSGPALLASKQLSRPATFFFIVQKLAE